MTLRQKQSRFARMMALLILYAFEQGFEVTLGDFYVSPEMAKCKANPHKKNSFHEKRLAGDLNLFLHGQYLQTTGDHLELGRFWESLGGTWGGRWDDGNHYSLGE